MPSLHHHLHHSLHLFLLRHRQTTSEPQWSPQRTAHIAPRKPALPNCEQDTEERKIVGEEDTFQDKHEEQLKHPSLPQKPQEEIICPVTRGGMEHQQWWLRPLQTQKKGTTRNSGNSLHWRTQDEGSLRDMEGDKVEVTVKNLVHLRDRGKKWSTRAAQGRVKDKCQPIRSLPLGAIAFLCD